MSRRPEVTRYDVVMYSITIFALALVTFSEGGFELRRFTNALGVAAFGLILWRLVSTWDRLTVLEHALTMLLAVGPLVSALASIGIQSNPAAVLPHNPWLWAVIVHRVACLVLVVWWSRWLGRKHSPFRSSAAVDRPHPSSPSRRATDR